MARSNRERGVIDTSVLIDLDRIRAADLPVELAISAITLAELTAGPHATPDLIERAHRQARLQYVEATLEPLPFDTECARAYGQVYASVVAAGRKARGRRALDLLIAATAIAADVPLYTRNPDDFSELTTVLDVVPTPIRL